MDRKNHIVQWFINLAVVIFTVIFLNKYIYSIVIELQKSLKDGNFTLMNELLEKLPRQMYLLFTFGIVVSIAVFVIYRLLGKRSTKYAENPNCESDGQSIK